MTSYEPGEFIRIGDALGERRPLASTRSCGAAAFGQFRRRTHDGADGGAAFGLDDHAIARARDRSLRCLRRAGEESLCTPDRR
jgi:hypothetical protein